MVMTSRLECAPHTCKPKWPNGNISGHNSIAAINVNHSSKALLLGNVFFLILTLLYLYKSNPKIISLCKNQLPVKHTTENASLATLTGVLSLHGYKHAQHM